MQVTTIIGVVLLLPGVLYSGFNWAAPLLSYRLGRRVSMVPLIGAMFLAGGLYLITGSIWWACLGVLLDPGTVALLLMTPWIARDLWATATRLRRLVSRDCGRTITLDLFRQGRARFDLLFDQAEAARHFEKFPIGTGFSAHWRMRDDGLEAFDYADGRQLVLTRDGEEYLATETTDREVAAADSLDGLRFRQIT